MKNTSYKLILSNNSEKYLKKLKKRNIDDFHNLLKNISLTVFNPYNSKVLHGKLKGLRRVKVGDYRIVFFIENKLNPPEIQIIEIGQRKNIYK
ncbi:MAG: type II toxin-antitoxin system mRNA interferase toxin, RelE/StbE family [Methanobrevibacter sp.]|nr:type II toxin-antitoxin system mRNA interferase toxin, RelE/StbE family [Methanobrevibacter sp.]